MKIITSILLLASIVLLTSFQQSASTKTSITRESGVKITILYPNEEGKNFDMDYYANFHMPMVARLLGKSLKRFAIDKGISGRTSADPMPYVAIGYLYFDQLSDYENAFAPHAEKIVSDIPNYTNIQPVIQISEVVQ